MKNFKRLVLIFLFVVSAAFNQAQAAEPVDSKWCTPTMAEAERQYQRNLSTSRPVLPAVWLSNLMSVRVRARCPASWAKYQKEIADMYAAAQK